jgi:hypothetical protein
MDSNLLKEAIADAKAVRQTALANAKAALEEAFGNRLEAMLTPKLEEETADQIPAPPVENQLSPEQGQGEVNETDIEQIIRELESELPQDGAAPAPAPMAPPMDAGAGAPPVGGAPVPPSPLGAAPCPAPMAPPMAPPMDAGAGAPPVGGAPVPPSPMGDEEMDEEIDVNELLESLKAEEEEEEKSGKPWEKKLDEGVPVNSSGIATSDNKKPSADASQTSHIETAGKDRVGGGEGYKSGPADATTASRPNQGKNVTKTNLSTPGGALKETKETGFPEGATVKTDDATKAARPNQADHATKTDLSTPHSKKRTSN